MSESIISGIHYINIYLYDKKYFEYNLIYEFLVVGNLRLCDDKFPFRCSATVERMAQIGVFKYNADCAIHTLSCIIYPFHLV